MDLVASIKLRNFRPHLRKTVEYGVSTHVWSNFSHMRMHHSRFVEFV